MIFLKFIKVTFLILHHFPVVLFPLFFPSCVSPFFPPWGLPVVPSRCVPMGLDTRDLNLMRAVLGALNARALAESPARGLRPQNVTFIVAKQEKSVFKNILKS